MTTESPEPSVDAPPFGLFFGDARELFDPDFTETPTLTSVDPHDRALANFSVFDLGYIRGDGIFEAAGVVNSVPLAWRLHLERLAMSAEMVELPVPNISALAAFTDAAIGATAAMSGDDVVEQAMVKLMVSRGADSWLSAAPSELLGVGATPDAPLPTVVVMVDCNRHERPTEAGIVTLAREHLKDTASRSPWLLLGAKTLSYATNMAAKREYERRGAQNAVFVTLDGYVMEGPQSSVVLREGDRLITPDPGIGILHGTTQQELFAWGALAKRYEVAYEDITEDRLRTADQIWIMGGGGVQSVTSIDGEPIKWVEGSAEEINAFLRTERAAIDAWTAENGLARSQADAALSS